MSKRDSRQASGLDDLMDGNGPTSAGMGLEELSRMGYQLPDDGGRVTIKPVSIFEIMPDPKQPRRQIPSAVRAAWDGQDVARLFDVWIDTAAAGRGTRYEVLRAEIEMQLRGEEVYPADVYQSADTAVGSGGVVDAALMSVVMLAADIKRDGLINPVTIAPINGQFGKYRIETGERRWLAYHLLYLAEGEEFAKIPAHQVSGGDVWRQASENTARSELNAISMARQLALLLMDLHGNDQFQTFEALVQPGESDRPFYAQVGDGQTWRVPRGKGEQLCNALGLSNPVQLRQYRNLLNLPDAVWMAADDLGWSENLLREMAGRAVNDKHMVEMARIEAAKVGYTVTTVTVSGENPHPLPPSPLHGEGESTAPQSPPPQAGREPVSKGETPEFSEMLEQGGLPESVWREFETPPQPSPQAGREPTLPQSHAHQGEGEPTGEGLPDTPPLTSYEINKVLEFAWKWVNDKRHKGGWFTAKDVWLSADVLEPLVDRMLLEQFVGEEGEPFGWFRITPSGCRRIKKSIPEWQSDGSVRWTPINGQTGLMGTGRPKVRPKLLIPQREQLLFDSVFALTDAAVAEFDDNERGEALQQVQACMDILERVGREISSGDGD